MKHLLHAVSFSLCAFLLLPAGVLAQNNGGPRSDEQLVIDVDRSDRMFRQAFRLSANNQNWKKAADQYVQSAQLRPYGDLKAYVALNRAGQIYSHLDNARAARRAFAAAGVRAMETAQVYEAAMAFADAAELSQQDRRDVRYGLDYARMAHRLSETRLLTEEQRKRIRNRLGSAGS